MVQEHFYETSDGRSLKRVSIENKASKTVKTHDGVPVNAGAFSITGWYDCEGYDKLGITGVIDGVGMNVTVEFSHDKIVLASNSTTIGTAVASIGKEIPVLANYFRVTMKNNDSVSRTPNIWVLYKL